MPEATKPTSPGPSARAPTEGVNTPTCLHWWETRSGAHHADLVAGRSVPLTTRTSITTPR